MNKYNSKYISIYLVFFLLTLSTTGCFETANGVTKSSTTSKIEPGKGDSKINNKLEKVLLEIDSKNMGLKQACNKFYIKCSIDKIFIDISFLDLNDSVIEAVRNTGVIPKTISKKYKRMSASFQKSIELKKLVDIEQVSIVSPEYGSITH